MKLFKGTEVIISSFYLCENIFVWNLLSLQIIMLSWEIWSSPELEIYLLPALLFHTVLFPEPFDSISAFRVIFLSDTTIFAPVFTGLMKMFKTCNYCLRKVLENCGNCSFRAGISANVFQKAWAGNNGITHIHTPWGFDHQIQSLNGS